MEAVFVVVLIFIGGFLFRHFLLGMSDVFEAARIYVEKNKKDSKEDDRLP